MSRSSTVGCSSGAGDHVVELAAGPCRGAPSRVVDDLEGRFLRGAAVADVRRSPDGRASRPACPRRRPSSTRARARRGGRSLPFRPRQTRKRSVAAVDRCPTHSPTRTPEKRTLRPGADAHADDDVVEALLAALLDVDVAPERGRRWPRRGCRRRAPGRAGRSGGLHRRHRSSCSAPTHRISQLARTGIRRSIRISSRKANGDPGGSCRGAELEVAGISPDRRT